MPCGRPIFYLSICRRPVIITNRSVMRTLAVLTFTPYPLQEARDSQNAAQDQPKTPRKRPRRRQQGPKRARRRAQNGPEAAQAGLWTTQARASSRWAAAPAVFWSKPGRFGAVLGSVLGPKLGR